MTALTHVAESTQYWPTPHDQVSHVSSLCCMYVERTFEHTWQLPGAPGGGWEGAGTTACTICVVIAGAVSTATPSKEDAAAALESEAPRLTATSLLAV